jgi:hypothetical protein
VSHLWNFTSSARVAVQQSKDRADLLEEPAVAADTPLAV